MAPSRAAAAGGLDLARTLQLASGVRNDGGAAVPTAPEGAPRPSATGEEAWNISSLRVSAAVLARGLPALAQERVPAVEICTATGATEAHAPIRHAGSSPRRGAPGLAVAVSPLELRTRPDRFRTGREFDATILGGSGRLDRLDPQVFRGTPDSRQTGLGANDPGGCSNPGSDALFDAPARASDIETRRDLVHEMQELSMPDVPAVIRFHRDEAVACDSMNAMAGARLHPERVPMVAEPVP